MVAPSHLLPDYSILPDYTFQLFFLLQRQAPVATSVCVPLLVLTAARLRLVPPPI